MSVVLYKVFQIENKVDMKIRFFLSFVNFAVLLEVSFLSAMKKNYITCETTDLYS